MGRWNGTELFEREIVLRAARYVYLFLAFLAFLAAVGAVTALAYGLSPVVEGFAPTPPPPPEEAIPDPAFVQIGREPLSAPRPRPAASSASGVAPAAAPAPVDTRPSERDALWASIRSGFNAGSAPWLDTTEVVCDQYDWMRRCMRSRVDVVTVGLSRHLQRTTASLSLDSEIDVLRALDALIATAPPEEAARYRVLLGGVALVDAWGADAVRPIDVWTAMPLGGPERVGIGDDLAAFPLGGTTPGQLSTWLRVLARPVRALPETSASTCAQKSWAIVSSFDVRYEEAADAVRLGLESSGPSVAPAFLDAYAEAVVAAERDAARERTAALVEYERALGQRAVAAAASRTWRTVAVTYGSGALPASLGVLAILGIGIAVLAVERNTRAIHALAKATT